MILPTVINVAEDAIRSVPREYKEGSLALGATHWQTIYRVIVPAASSGIMAGVVLGMGRAIGETMAIIMVAGNAPIVPESIFSSVRSLTGNIAIEMAYSSGEHTQALFATGIILFVFIMIINSLAMFLAKKEVG
jgi:phosphate transport system permease protein